MIFEKVIIPSFTSTSASTSEIAQSDESIVLVDFKFLINGIWREVGLHFFIAQEVNWKIIDGALTPVLLILPDPISSNHVTRCNPHVDQ